VERRAEAGKRLLGIANLAGHRHQDDKRVECRAAKRVHTPPPPAPALHSIRLFDMLQFCAAGIRFIRAPSTRGGSRTVHPNKLHGNVL
jgi:hypothetical protein